MSPYWLKHFTKPAKSFARFGVDVFVPWRFRPVFDLTAAGLPPEGIAASLDISAASVVRQQEALHDLMIVHRQRLNKVRCAREYLKRKRRDSRISAWPDLDEHLPCGFLSTLHPNILGVFGAAPQQSRQVLVRGQRFIE